MRSIHQVARNLRVVRNMLPRRSGQKGRVTKRHAMERSPVTIQVTGLAEELFANTLP
jgi:hypothetical protein